MPYRLCSLVSLLGLGVLLVGCESSTRKYAVKGEVAIKGKSVAGGVVVFEMVHADPAQRVSAQAEIAEDQTFKLEVPEGEYRVQVLPPMKLGTVEGSARAWPFNKKFGSFDTSGLKFKVTPDEKANQFKISLD